MNHLIRSEWVKFRSVRSTVITLAVAGALVVLFAVVFALQSADDNNSGGFTCRAVESGQTTTTTAPPTTPGEPGLDASNPCGDGAELVPNDDATHLGDLTAGVNIAMMLFGVLGVQVIGQEYRFNTIRPTFTAVPNRFKVLAAKVVVVTTACASVAVVMVGLCWAVGLALADNFTVDGLDHRVAFGIVLFSALWSAAGVGVGAIVRQPVAGIVILVGESILGEAIIGGLIDSTVKWLPFNNGFQMTQRPGNGPGGDLQSVLAGGIYFAAICALLVAIGMVLVDRRDA